MEKPIEWIIELSVAENGAEDVNDLLVEMSRTFEEHEPGTEIWSWFWSRDRTQISIHERFRDEAATFSHLENFGQFAKGFLVLLSPTKFTVLADATPSLREAIEGFNPVFFSPAGGLDRRIQLPDPD